MAMTALITVTSSLQNARSTASNIGSIWSGSLSSAATAWPSVGHRIYTVNNYRATELRSSIHGDRVYSSRAMPSAMATRQTNDVDRTGIAPIIAAPRQLGLEPPVKNVYVTRRHAGRARQWRLRTGVAQWWFHAYSCRSAYQPTAAARGRLLGPHAAMVVHAGMSRISRSESPSVTDLIDHVPRPCRV